MRPDPGPHINGGPSFVLNGLILICSIETSAGPWWNYLMSYASPGPSRDTNGKTGPEPRDARPVGAWASQCSDLWAWGKFTLATDGDFRWKTCCWEKWSANVTLLQWENVWVEFTASSYLPSAPSCKHSNCWFTGLFRAFWCIGHFVHVLWLKLCTFEVNLYLLKPLMQCKITENGQKCNYDWCESWSLPSCSKWYPLVLRSNWKSLGWIIKIRLHFIISPQPGCLWDQVRCWCYTQLRADTKTGIIFLSVALWMDIKGINQLCRIRKRIID